jgi:hypothetical protein
MISSTITRPTSIAATSSCDQKIALVETVDVGPMGPQKPRTISLEPISRRTRRMKTVKNKESGSQETTDTSGSEPTRAMGSPLPDESASQCGSVDHQINPRSPIPSDRQSNASAATSADSTVSSSTGLSFRLGAVPSSAKSTRDSQRTGRNSLADKTITATIELLKSGCLPGDNLPLKISIKHTKAIKSMHGIIITLYRQGRIESAPPLSLFVDIKGKEAEKLKHEEYYPKSKTGLSGLSLTSAGSSSVFRKDLAQTFAPILIDPTTLTAVINASVRVPEDVFPTISGVPGEMISFKYHVEVVVDLGGKLAGQSRHVPRVGQVTLPSSWHGSTNGREANPNMLAAWGGSIVDTDHIRREKSVAACLFQVTVGTIDSTRKRARGNSFITRQMHNLPDEIGMSPVAPTHEPIYEESVAPHNEQDAHGEQPYPYPYYDEQYPEFYSNGGYHHHEPYYEQYPLPEHTEIAVPAPEIQAEQGLSEKERVRRAEERLLPSQPPPDIAGPSSPWTVVAPTAPSILPDEPEEDLYSPEDATPQGAPTIMCMLSHKHTPEAANAPSAPALEEINSNAAGRSTEDKQELERRRLLAEASEPSEFPGDEDDNGGEGSSGLQHQPTAPALTEEDEYGGQYTHHSVAGPAIHDQSLPKYER